MNTNINSARPNDNHDGPRAEDTRRGDTPGTRLQRPRNTVFQHGAGRDNPNATTTDHGTRRVTCGYIQKNHIRCTGEVADPDGEIMLCISHLAAAMRVYRAGVRQAKRNARKAAKKAASQAVKILESQGYDLDRIK